MGKSIQKSWSTIVALIFTFYTFYLKSPALYLTRYYV